MDEFDLIERYFKPLSVGFSGSLGLTDDAAIISVPPGYELAITKDAISAGVHFLGSETPQQIAQKLLRVNLSDLAAMGAAPLAYFLAVMLPKDTKAQWVEAFAQGLAADQKRFGIHLAGGDTISFGGPLTFSLTALGTVPVGKALRRNAAKAGDVVFVSGTLGDSALGLASLRAQRGNPAHQHGQSEPISWIATSAAPPRNDEAFLRERYFLPEPRLELGRQLIGIANGCMDISDGLMQDLGHICKASGVGAVLHRGKLPLSEAAARLVHQDARWWDSIVGGGDDYELLFTVPKDRLALVETLPVTAIGEIMDGSDVRLLDETGTPLAVAQAGFKHRT